MGKKHKHPEHENLERWLVSYADFITLLFATFVVLYALSMVDLAKFKNMSQGIRQAFDKTILKNPGGIMSGEPKSSILPKQGNSVMDKINPKYPVPPEILQNGATRPLGEAVQKINSELKEQAKKWKENAEKNGKGKGKDGQGSANLPDSLKQEVSVHMENRGIVISFSSSMFFASGSSGLKPEAYKVLAQILKPLKDTGKVIHVEGHTDNRPIASAIYPSNWELSSSRASSVVRNLIKQGLSPNMLVSVGYADTRPIATNDTEDGRRRNRRVDIVIMSTTASQVTEPLTLPPQPPVPKATKPTSTRKTPARTSISTKNTEHIESNLHTRLNVPETNNQGDEMPTVRTSSPSETPEEH